MDWEQSKTSKRINVKSEAKPKFSKARSVPFALQEVVETEIDRLEEIGVLRSVSYSEWASPITIVTKPDGTVRICGDYKNTINPVIENDIYPLPSADEVFAKVQGGKRFSKIDLTQEYTQVELEEESKKYLVLNISRGLKEPNRMFYGAKPNSGLFQRHMATMLHDVPKTVVRIDDVLTTGSEEDDHFDNLEKVLVELEKAGAKVNLKKCRFFVPEDLYIGFIISEKGIRNTPEKVKAIKEIPEPTCVKQVHARFIPNMSAIAQPLYKLLEKRGKWQWTDIQRDAFRTLKEKLTESPILCTNDPKLPVLLACDASNYGIGAVILHQFPDGKERPIAFVSRTLNKHEISYSQIDKEGAAVIFALKKFNQYLLGREFKIITDNKAIRKMFNPSTALSSIAIARITRWSLILSQYNYTTEFKSTKDNANADMMSRLPLEKQGKGSEEDAIYNVQIATLPVSDENIRTETEKDEILSQVKRYLKTGKWPDRMIGELQSYYNKREELFIEEDILLWGLRVVIPYSLKKNILKELHCQHPGVVRMKALSRIHVWYPQIDKDIEETVKKCNECQQVANEPPKSRDHPWSWPSKPMDRVHLDFFIYQNMNYLIMVDSYSKSM